MIQYPIGPKGILMDLGSPDRELIQIATQVLIDNSEAVDAQGSLITKRTRLYCAKPVMRTAASGRKTIFINSGATHTLVLMEGENDPSWDRWSNFKVRRFGTILERKGLSVVAPISSGGGNWIEIHCYPVELYTFDTYIEDGKTKDYIDRPIIPGDVSL
jgi:hypothetical protein